MRTFRLIPSRENSPTRHSIEPQELMATKQELYPKMVIFMCGLPARGKSYVSKRLCRYLRWTGFRTEVFNVGHRRRKSVSSQPLTKAHDQEFFNPANSEAKSKRDKWARDVLLEVVEYLKSGGSIAIHDATNSTVERRKMLMDYLAELTNTPTSDGVLFEVKAIFVESICTDKELIDANIELKTHSPDYINMDPEQAKQDFRARLKNYEKTYQTLGKEDEAWQSSYVQLIDVGKKLIAYNIDGYIQSQIVFYLMNIHIHPREIWLSSPGFIGNADGALDDGGHSFSVAFARYITARYAEPNEKIRRERGTEKLEVLTSMERGAIQMAEYFPSDWRYRHSAFLSEMSDFELDSKNPFRLLVERLRPLVIELEHIRHSVLVIACKGVLSALAAYFFNVAPADASQVTVPEHCGICLKPMPFGTGLMVVQYDRARNCVVEKHVEWPLSDQTRKA